MSRASAGGMYRGFHPPRHIVVGEKSIVVDSKLEERVIRQLDASGYAGFWDKPKLGIQVWRYNYTPDLELSVFFEGVTHRALVEIKPAKDYLTPDISKRIRGVARYYHSKLLLLYADKEKQWYHIDPKSGELTTMSLPPPGKKPINKLYKPISLSGRRIYAHHYKKRLNPLVLTAKVITEILATVLEVVSGPPQRKYYRSRRKHR